jgi:hypothetical protein
VSIKAGKGERNALNNRISESENRGLNLIVLYSGGRVPSSGQTDGAPDTGRHAPSEGRETGGRGYGRAPCLPLLGDLVRRMRIVLMASEAVLTVYVSFTSVASSHNINDPISEWTSWANKTVFLTESMPSPWSVVAAVGANIPNTFQKNSCLTLLIFVSYDRHFT